MKPEAIIPESFPWFDYSGFTFSLGVDLGDLVFNSGHTGASYDPEVGKMAIGGPMSGQVTVAYEKAETILGGVGLTFDDVVLVTEYVTVDGLEFYDDVKAAREKFLGGVRPAVSTVVVDRLVRRKAYVEIEITASRTRDVAGPGDPAKAASREAADGTVYLSTIHPYDENGALVGGDDVSLQVEQIFKNARTQLQALGLDTSDIVKTLEMIRPEALPTYKGTGRVRKEYLGPVYPGAAGILQRRVATDDRVLISYDIIASRHEAEAINPGWDRYEKLTYSPAVKAGNMIWMSGQAALDPETERAVHAGDIVEQTRYTYRNILATLEAADLGPEALVRTVEYVVPAGLPDYAKTSAIRSELLREPWPASTGAFCHALLRPEFLIEIDPTAVVLG